MKAPLSWLREYVAIELDPLALADRLAMTGTEVERVDFAGIAADGDNLSHFVVGKVLSRERHPNADKLSVCLVDVGGEQPRTIVCGAPNVAGGQTVAVVLPGAVMPNGMAIKEAKLRGVASSGMIMSAAELEFEAKSEGILVLPDDWGAGTALNEHLPVAEAILEVEVTPNRPDCLSIVGLAREVAAVTEAPFSGGRSHSFPTSDRPVDEEVRVEVRDPDLCPRYAARVIQGVTVAESPAWLKARITHAGMRPVNNVVDVTNYVMWAVGQPLHAFDLEAVTGRTIIVRRALPGEPITTLDGTTRTLTDEMLVIADSQKPSVIAGIMGSLDSEVTEDTTNILLEAANFNGPSIMRTSSALGLRSESSTRFEKGLDRNLVPVALDMACALLTEVCGGMVAAGTVDVLAEEVGPWVVSLRPARVDTVLGEAVGAPAMASILERLGCGVASGGEGPEGEPLRFDVTVPTFRADLQREIDLIEEVARIYGVDRLPATMPARRGRGGLTPAQRCVREVEDLLRGVGLSEVITYAFTDPSWLGRLRLHPDDDRLDPVTLANPLSADQSVMRTMLLPGLLDTAQRNRSVREDRVHLFEVGKTFHASADRETMAAATGREAALILPREVGRVGILLLGDWVEPSWAAAPVPTDFFLAKGIVERLLADLRVEATYRPATEQFLHPGKSAVVTCAAGVLGWVGEVHPLVLKAFDLPAGAQAAELDLDLLVAASEEVPLFEDLITFPEVEQDFALVVSRDVTAQEVIDTIRAAGGPLLHHLRVFDVYEGSQVGEGRRSLALRLLFRSPERTLSEAEVNDVRETLLDALRDKLGAELRG
jgi:phenylalanyl-tRNA synthetase beta chain